MSRQISIINNLASDLARREGYELVDVSSLSTGKSMKIQVFIHRPGGVTVEDCRFFSRSLGTILEVEEAVRFPFILEVSSPGLDRHMKTPADFSRNIGRVAKVVFFDREGKTAQATGSISAVEGDTVFLETEEGTIGIPHQAVKKAHPVIDWKELFKKSEKALPSGEKR